MAQSIQNTFGQAGITVELKVGEGAEQLEEYRARLHRWRRCKAGVRTIPTRTPTRPPLRENPDNADEDEEHRLSGLAQRL